MSINIPKSSFKKEIILKDKISQEVTMNLPISFYSPQMGFDKQNTNTDFLILEENDISYIASNCSYINKDGVFEDFCGHFVFNELTDDEIEDVIGAKPAVIAEAKNFLQNVKECYDGIIASIGYIAYSLLTRQNMVDLLEKMEFTSGYYLLDDVDYKRNAFPFLFTINNIKLEEATFTSTAVFEYDNNFYSRANNTLHFFYTIEDDETATS